MKKLSGLVAAMIICCQLYASSSGNILKNPNLDKGTDIPDGWKFQTVAPEIFNLKWEKNCPDGAFFQMESIGADYSGYLSQQVKVEPKQRYRLSLQVKQAKGRALIYITGRDKNNKPVAYDQRKYMISFAGHPLVPDFVEKSLMKGSDNDDWRTETFEFVTENNGKEIDNIYLQIGIYYSQAMLCIRKLVLEKISE